MTHKVNQNNVLAVEYVEEDYFLDRIAALEAKYTMSWGDFFGKWLSKENHEILVQGDGHRYADFSEWAFLCTSLMPVLLTRDAECPPGYICDESNSEEPDYKSGFSLFGGRTDRLTSV